MRNSILGFVMKKGNTLRKTYNAQSSKVFKSENSQFQLEIAFL